MKFTRAAAVTAAGAALALGGTACRSGQPSAASQPPPVSARSPTPAGTHAASHHAAADRSARAAPAASGCNASLWSHVYHSYRLHVVSRCKTVRGTVEDVRWEPDGDLHIRLAVSRSLVDDANVSYEHGDLVLEVICQGTVTQGDAIGPCRGVHQHVTVPSAGDKVKVWGSYVRDADHGWMEIHPVSRITVTGHASVTPPAPAPTTQAPPPPPPSSAPPAPAGCYPKTSSGNCYQPGEFCPHADAGMTGVAGDGKTITCELVSGYYRWED